MGDWRARKAKGFSLPRSSSLRTPPTSILRTSASRKSKRKSVSWADQQRVVEGSQSSRGAFDNWVSKVKRVRLKVADPLSFPSGVNDTEVENPSSQVEGIGSKPTSTEEAPPPEVGDGSNEAPAIPGETPATANETLANHDSDLSDLTDLSSSESSSQSDGESETSDGSTEVRISDFAFSFFSTLTMLFSTTQSLSS